MAYQASVDVPQFDPANFWNVWNQFLDASGANEAMGVKSTVQYSGGYAIGDALRDAGWKNSDLQYLAKKTGLNLDKGVQYGSSGQEIARLQDVVSHLISTYKAEGGIKSDGAIQGGIERLNSDANRFGISNQSMGFEKMPGFQGISDQQKAETIRKWQLANPNKDFFKDQSLIKQAQAFGLKSDEYGSKEAKQASDFAKSEAYQTFTTAQDIFRQQLDIQKESLQNYQEALNRVRTPGYATNLVNQSFAPTQAAIDKYYQPYGGATSSQAEQDVGEREAALGRSGYDRVAVELARQRGAAYTDLAAKKSAAVADLQKYIDLGNPAEALRYGSELGQSSLMNQNYFKNQLLAPYAQVFPLTSQQYGLQLQPYSYQSQVQQPPSGFDYAIAGAGALGNIGQGVGALMHGKF